MSASNSSHLEATRRVVVVDDEVAIAHSLKALLNHAGDAHAMFSGQELVDSLETLRPDVLITDRDMLGISGIVAAIITRSKFPNCKILLFSAQSANSSLLV